MKVKVYKNNKRYERDAKKLGKKGWKVISVVQEKRSAGLGRWALIGIFAPLFPPKPVLVVTYEKR